MAWDFRPNGRCIHRLEGARMDIKQIVKNNVVRFSRYRQGHAYYCVDVPAVNATYSFPVPLDDVGDATLLSVDKALVFMRYIRKAMDEGTFIREPEAASHHIAYSVRAEARP